METKSSAAGKWIIIISGKVGAPFSVMVTSETLDFSDPSILRVPAFML